MKTDSVDAKMPAELAEVLNRRPDRERFIKPMPDEAQQQLHALVLRRRRLVRLMVSKRQRKHMAHADVVQGILDLMAVLVQEIETMDRKIAEHLARHQPDQASLLKSIKGVGSATAATVISELPDLGRLSPKQICALVGVASMNRDPGQLRGKRIICGGASHRKKCLVHGRYRGDALQPSDSELLLALGGRRKTQEGGHRCMHAKATHRDERHGREWLSMGRTAISS